MDDLEKKDMREALKAIDSMIGSGEKPREKFSPGTSQHSLQANRIKALRIASFLIERELEQSGERLEFTKEDLEKALAPINSLIRKSEKAQKNLAPDAWQYNMLDGNLRFLPLLVKELDEINA